VQLANLGLFNEGDQVPSLKHFKEIHSMIDSEILFSSEETVSTQLDSMFQGNKHLQINNIPLDETLRYISPEIHLSDSGREKGDYVRTNIDHIITSDTTPYMLTGSNDGSVHIWNTEVGLLDLAKDINFKDLPQKELIQLEIL
jgi:WD40 repeat protein